MRDIIECMSVFCKLPQNADQTTGTDSNKCEVKDSSSTQTEIVAVHTPQVENLPFPFASKLPRPSTLSLIDSNDASSSVRKISENDADEIGKVAEEKDSEIHEKSGSEQRTIENGNK